ncbi:MFS transporter [Actinokineospora iranica]|uniref:Predicted arabinose efflux permease, MFS family n=1 Tax=Actinokineospora iranica TaxID=1271860 RepID=A0A1G6TFX8_9PSEU|nr:MFS transporter [Actinokineospora iranica]SDD27980.1 Predicted arabinose efflux permease, MFS family [Actinokineospora iranica]
MIRNGPADQPPSGRRGREGRFGAGRKARRGWADAPQPPWRDPEPPHPEPRQPEPRQPRSWANHEPPPPPHAPRRYGPPPRNPTRRLERPDEPEYETYGDRYRDRPYSDRYDDRYQDRRYDDRYDSRYEDRRPDSRYSDEHYRDEHYRDNRYRDSPDRDEHYRDDGYREEPPVPGAPQFPKKLTVTRVAALRGKQLTSQAVNAFHKATRADGADKSGLTSLTYATMLNYAGDAAMAVALANTLFFSAASGESKGKVALYLLITVAPFALLAPVIGPMLDRLQRGRRFAMCAASAGQALMCVIMAMHFDDWMLYPAALGKMVLSKSFTVLKAAITPRVLPPEITLAKSNARLTVFGLAAGGVFGAFAALFANIFDSPGALWFTVVICLFGAVQALRIPAWVEVTEGEVPASISAHPKKAKRQPMGRHVVVSLWGNGTIRVLTGFLMMFAAFAVRAEHEAAPFQQVLLLGLIAGAAGLGSFVGNGIGARLHVGNPEQVVLGCAIGALASTVVATFAAGIATAALVGLVGAIASALAKNSLDAVIQDDLPEESRASAFGRSETVLQLGWVFGGAVGVLLPPIWWVGFLVVSAMLALGLTQTLMSRRGATLIPGLGGDRPAHPGRATRQPRGRFRPAALPEGPPPHTVHQDP